MYNFRYTSSIVFSFVLSLLFFSCEADKSLQILNRSGRVVELQLGEADCASFSDLYTLGTDGEIRLRAGADTTFALGAGGWTYTERIALETCVENALDAKGNKSVDDPVRLIVNAFGYKDGELTVTFE